MQRRYRVSSWADDVVVDRLCVSWAYLDKGSLGIALVVTYVYIDNPLIPCRHRHGASCRLALSSKDSILPAVRYDIWKPSSTLSRLARCAFQLDRRCPRNMSK